MNKKQTGTARNGSKGLDKKDRILLIEVILRMLASVQSGKKK